MINAICISIKWQLEKIRLKIEEAIIKIDKVKNDKYQLLIEIAHLKEAATRKKIPIGHLLFLYYLFDHEFELAWIISVYFGYFSIDRKLGSLPFEIITNEDMKNVGKDKIKGQPNSSHLVSNYFRLDDEKYNTQRRIDAMQNVIKNDTQKRHGGMYDISPVGRHIRLHDIDNYYMTYYGFLEAAILIEQLWALDLMEDCEEVLFRMRYALSKGEPPSNLNEFPSHYHLISLIEFYDNWLHARQTSLPDGQKTMAWKSIFWYLEYTLRSQKKKKYSFYLDIERGSLLSLIAEFDLFDELQPEFLRNFKYKAAFASISVCQKMVADPTPIIEFRERGLPDSVEFQRMYEQMFPKK